MSNLINRALRTIRSELGLCWGRTSVRSLQDSVAPDPLEDLSDGDKAIITKAKPFTMTSVERMAAVITAIDHIVAKGIPGDIAECGVWRGGSMMVAAMALASE